ncbi:SidA/IucD/PvdA family monooxygenase [Kribbella sp. NPDC051587]|uniref:SidA/IucD/PvdA family monooxygenase n=1 Tax=Kribbella sp. NPDC051587 TaxID=3364119 RepID=UPI003790E17D
MTVHDVLGIGFGPGGIALAAALEEEAPQLSCLFLEARETAAWQPGMLLRGSDTQHHPSRDLATLRDPRSRYTFLNYLHETGRLVGFLNLPAHFPLRRDYARYVTWVAQQLSGSVRYSAQVVDIAVESGHHVVTTSDGSSFRGRALVIGTGRSPYVPSIFEGVLGDSVFHSSEYLWRIAARREALRRPLTVAVVGGSQSAAELALDLHSGSTDRVIAVTRGFGYRQKDTSPFSEEAYFPEHTDYYYNATPAARASLDAQLRPSNYSSVDLDVLEDLYLRRYEDSIDGQERLLLRRNQEVTNLVAGETVRLDLASTVTREHSHVDADVVILATGYRDLGPAEHQEPFPAVLAPLVSLLDTDSDGVLRVERDYFVPGRAADMVPVFLNGLCESTHGLGDSGSFSLLSLRARTLVEGIRKHLAGTVVAD